MMNRLGTAGVLIVLYFAYGVPAQSLASCRGGIVFDAWREPPPDGARGSDRTQIPTDLYLIASDGTRERQLTFSKPGEFSRTPKVSPDGQHVVFDGRRELDGQGLYVMTCADGQVTRVTATGTSPGPAWAPDGRQVAFSTGVGAARAISIVDIVTMTVRKLGGLPSDSSGPSWSPDGKHVAFVSMGDVTWEIFTVELGSGQVRQLTRTTDARTSSQGPAWSPDGSKIAFDRASNGKFDVYVMNSDGTGIVQLTHDPGDAARPRWSSDGRSIVFHSTGEIYAMAADGSNVRRLTTNQYPKHNAHPDW